MALNGAAITSIYGVEALLTYSRDGCANKGTRWTGRTTALTGGICDRTAQVRDELVDLVEANHSGVTNCSLVDPAVHLPELTGTLNLNGFGNPMTGIKAGDFAGLTGITTLILIDNRLRDIPAGVFDPLTALTILNG